jgi:glycine amidinotransferase
MAKIVNSWNEWDPLKRVIVGRTDVGGMLPQPEPGAVVGPMVGMGFDEWGPFPEQVVAEATAEMEAFVKMLEGRGIQVDRPAELDLTQTVHTPDWEHAGLFTLMPPRDILMAVGCEILEATMSQRSRWFEFIAYRPILEAYFKRDPEFQWEAAPKPRLTERSFEPGFWENFHNVWSEEEKRARMMQGKFKNSDAEPLFDVADALRCGKDIFVQLSMPTTRSGIDWMRRHLEPKGFRVHEVQFDTIMPWHIDTTVFCPREGLLFQNPNWMPLGEEFHELFRINGWEIVECAPPGRTETHRYSSSSFYLGYNVFSLDPANICVEAAEKPLMEQLASCGIEPIPVHFNNVSPFGGGLHCATVDVHREGECEDYFPRQIPGY